MSVVVLAMNMTTELMSVVMINVVAVMMAFKAVPVMAMSVGLNFSGGNAIISYTIGLSEHDPIFGF